MDELRAVWVSQRPAIDAEQWPVAIVRNRRDLQGVKVVCHHGHARLLNVVIGGVGATIDPMLYGSFFDGVIAVNKTVPVMAEMKEEFHGPIAMAIHSVQTLPFWLMVAGLVVTYYFYMVKPSIPAALAKKFSGIYKLMDNRKTKTASFFRPSIERSDTLDTSRRSRSFLTMRMRSEALTGDFMPWNSGSAM